MLPAESRLRRRADFTAVVHSGRRVGCRHLVVHLDVPVGIAEPALAGFVVSRLVGPAVVRNRVRRQLRHLVAPRLAELPAGAKLVVRALPAAAGQPARVLGDDLDRLLRQAASRAANHGRRPPRVAAT